ncbi:MAG: hypothetical protein AB7S93_27055 [Xanthobacteraceae bacterium]
MAEPFDRPIANAGKRNGHDPDRQCRGRVSGSDLPPPDMQTFIAQQYAFSARLAKSASLNVQ